MSKNGNGKSWLTLLKIPGCCFSLWASMAGFSERYMRMHGRHFSETWDTNEIFKILFSTVTQLYWNDRGRIQCWSSPNFLSRISEGSFSCTAGPAAMNAFSHVSSKMLSLQLHNNFEQTEKHLQPPGNDSSFWTTEEVLFHSRKSQNLFDFECSESFPSIL